MVDDNMANDRQLRSHGAVITTTATTATTTITTTTSAAVTVTTSAAPSVVPSVGLEAATGQASTSRLTAGNNYQTVLAINSLNRLFHMMTVAGYEARDGDYLQELETQADRYWQMFEENHMRSVSQLAEGVSWVDAPRAPMAEASAAPTEPSPMAEVRLEKIKIPKFDGQPHNWATFKNLFQTMVHDTALPEIAKYTHLRNALGPEALKAIQGIHMGPGAYQGAWQTLLNRYDDKQVIVGAHLRRFLGLETMRQETNDGLRNIIDVTNEVIRSLQAIGIPVEHWDVLFTHVILSKLPDRSTLAWKQLANVDPFPPITQLLDFLENRARALDHARSTAQQQMAVSNVAQQTSTNRPAYNRNATQTPPLGRLFRSNIDTAVGKCPHCAQQHSIYQCESFKALSPLERFVKIKGSDLCFNCLRKGHPTRLC